MLNFSIGPGTDHLQELRNYARQNSCTNKAVLSILFQEIELPISEYLQNIIGMPFEYANESVAEHATFGLFHSIPDIHSLGIGTLEFISRAVVAKNTQVAYPVIIRTDIGDDSVTIYYDVAEYRVPVGYGAFNQQLRVQPSLRYSMSISSDAINPAVAELVGEHRLPIAQFGDLNCYSVSVEEISAAITKHIKVSGLSSDYVLLRDILQRLYPTYEAFLAERSFIVNAGKISNELAAMYPEHAWKEAVTLEQTIYHIGFLRDRLGAAIELGTSLRTFHSLNEQDRNKFLADVYQDTRTKEELDNAELEVALKSALDRVGYSDDQNFFTIVVQDQPSTPTINK